MKFMVSISLLLSSLFSLHAQSVFVDTIQLTDGNIISGYLIGNGFTVVRDEHQHFVDFKKNIRQGIYILMYKNHLVAKVNHINKKENVIIQYEDDTTIASICYQPYIRIMVDPCGLYYRITAIENYKKNDLIEFQLYCDQCYMRIRTKKHKRIVELVNLEIL